MSNPAIRTIQARCAALGFWPGPIDGRRGPRTTAAEKEARESQKSKGLPFIHASGLSRIHWHWTGGGHEPNPTDRAAYHNLLTGEGKLIEAHELRLTLAHTLNANTGAIAISLCAMAGAVERPFNPGRHPVTPKQIGALARRVAVLSKRYDIPISPWSTLGHSEVQPSLGIPQRQKWDINWIPGMAAPGDPISVGNRIREMAQAQLGALW